MPKEGYTRAGKITSDGRYMGALNKDIERGGQHRYDNIVFGVQSEGKLGQLGGAVPQGYFQVDSEQARQYLAGMAKQGTLADAVRIGAADGSIYINERLQRLLDAGVAVDMAKASPQVRQLL